MAQLMILGGDLDGQFVEMPDEWETIIVPRVSEHGMDYPMFRRENRNGVTVLVEVPADG